MYVCMYYVCMYVLCMYVCIMYVCMNVRTSVCIMYVCTDVRMYVCIMYECTYVRMYACMHACQMFAFCSPTGKQDISICGGPGSVLGLCEHSSTVADL